MQTSPYRGAAGRKLPIVERLIDQAARETGRTLALRQQNLILLRLCRIRLR